MYCTRDSSDSCKSYTCACAAGTILAMHQFALQLVHATRVSVSCLILCQMGEEARGSSRDLPIIIDSPASSPSFGLERSPVKVAANASRYR